MTYNVFGGTLNLAQPQFMVQYQILRLASKYEPHVGREQVSK